MKKEYKDFQNIVLEYYELNGRYNLPWRVQISPYRVLVSEIMLQQTQVERVISFFEKWIEEFPNWHALANAPQSQVLKLWKGLGYNSRALRLQKLAQIVDNDLDGILPSDFKELCALPGIGNYTAAAVRAFAFNEYTPLIETNVRRVFIHHFFTDQNDIDDKQIMSVINDIGAVDNPRQWYAALMDYGSTLPKIIKNNPNRRSKNYTKQSKFEGSNRQIRGKILDVLLNVKSNKISQTKLFNELIINFNVVDQEVDNEKKRYKKITQDLVQEGFLVIEGRSIKLVH